MVYEYVPSSLTVAVSDRYRFVPNSQIARFVGLPSATPVILSSSPCATTDAEALAVTNGFLMISEAVAYLADRRLSRLFGVATA